MDFPGQVITAKGSVNRKYQLDGNFLVDCTIWLENPDGQNTTPGTATIELPSKGVANG